MDFNKAQQYAERVHKIFRETDDDDRGLIYDQIHDLELRIQKVEALLGITKNPK